MPNESPPKYRDYKEFRFADLIDKGYDIKENPQDYHYIEYQNPVTKNMDRDFYHVPTLKKVGEMAVKRKLDPWTAMQIAASESHGGLLGGGRTNPMHSRAAVGFDETESGDMEAALTREDIFTELEPENRGKVKRIWDTALPSTEDIWNRDQDREQEAYVSAALDKLEQVQKKYGKTATAIQAYSGTAARPTRRYMAQQYDDRKVFGQDADKINMWRDQPQAKRVKALEPHIKAIPALREAFPQE